MTNMLFWQPATMISEVLLEVKLMQCKSTIRS